jgi:hypothetical protein
MYNHDDYLNTHIQPFPKKDALYDHTVGGNNNRKRQSRQREMDRWKGKERKGNERGIGHLGDLFLHFLKALEHSRHS